MKQTAQGTTPPGAETEEQAAQWVRRMFGEVAPRYDLLNHLLSGNIDRYWRWRSVRRTKAILARQGVRVLDLCCGTGDLLLALQRHTTSTVLGSDFCHPMLIAARQKIETKRWTPILFEADAMRLPLKDGSLDLVTVAFGFRNLANYQAGLEELRRVLAPGAAAAILEFSQPPNRAFRTLYNWYSQRLLPGIGALISGSREAYTYLPDSVSKFPDAEGLARAMRDAGFARVEFELITGGIVALHLGYVASAITLP